MTMNLRHTLIILTSTLLLTACASSKQKAALENDGPTVSQIYSDVMGSASLDDLESIRGASYARHTAGYFSIEDGESPYQRLYNPDITLYIYPHMASIDSAPIPGYTTVFPLYDKTIYAMPGEPVAGK